MEILNTFLNNKTIHLLLIVFCVIQVKSNPITEESGRIIENQYESNSVDIDESVENRKILNESYENYSAGFVNEVTIEQRFEDWQNTFWNANNTPEYTKSVQGFRMKKIMNDSVDPCDDFYEYACGNWETVNPIPKDKFEYNLFSLLNDNLELALKKMLNDNDNISSLITENETVEQTDSALIKIVNFYDSCMNTDVQRNRGAQPMLDYLEELGGWPVYHKNWSENNFDWLNVTAQMRFISENVLIGSAVEADLRYSNEHIFYIEETTFPLSGYEDFIDPENTYRLNIYKDFMRAIMKMLGINDEDTDRTVNELIDFETDLANITSEDEGLTLIDQYKRMTIEELQNEIPEIDWHRYVSIVLDHPIETSIEIVNLSKDYMKKLAILVNSTSAKTLANYLLWRVVYRSVDYLGADFLEAKENMKMALSGKTESSPQWKTCVACVNTYMGMAMGAKFVSKYFDENSKNDVIEMTNELKNEFRKMLNEADWLDDETKKLAQIKVNTLSLKIGYPDFIKSNQELNKYYETLKIHPEKYFENILNSHRYNHKDEMDKFGKPVDKTKWIVSPGVVNAYFKQNTNDIIIPAGILQPPFYHRNLPNFLKYGGIGVFIGHEITHGFDDFGAEFDHEGNMVPWWSDNSTVAFKQRSRCLVNQYNAYKLHGKSVNGGTSKSENIADNGGIRQSFSAYKSWMDRNKNSDLLQNEHLPELNMTNEQIFFLGFAQVWCSAIRPEGIDERMKSDYHCPGKYRVIGTLSNMKEFSDSFNCPAGSKMNPEDKCRVW